MRTFLALMLTLASASAYGQVPWSEFAADLPAGSNVTVPNDLTVSVDVSEITVGSLQIEGILEIPDVQDVEITASRIMIMGSGAMLRAGSHASPFQNNLTITLTEPVGDEMNAPPMGYRALGVMFGGSLQLHGQAAAKTSWTQIDGDVEPGATSLQLVEATGWLPGDRIALAPSGEDPREAERFVITGVSTDGLRVSFQPPLSHAHLGRALSYAGKTIDMRAEIALLSRNIVIRNRPDESGPDGHPDNKTGFHTMIMPDAGRVELVGVEFVGGGQIARPGRYPIHWHRNPALETQIGPRHWEIEAPNRKGDIVKRCSVHSSGQRGIVLHGVNGVRLEQNIVFDVWDHAYVFSEDGIEKDNELYDNLAILVKRKARNEFAFPRNDHTESDQAEHRPCGFWGRNPFNPMVGNVAAGTVEGIGFFIDSQVMSFDVLRLIQRVHAFDRDVVFTTNRSHSNWFELVEGAAIPTYGPKTRGHGLMVGDYNAAFEAIFEDFQTYRNSVLGVWIEDDAHVLRDAILTDSSGGFIAFRSRIEDVVFNQRSDNALGREPQVLGNRRYPAGGLHMQSTGYGNHPNLNGVTFMNVEPAAVFTWASPLSSDGGPSFSGIRLINTRAIYQGADPASFDGTYTDLDGSLTGMGAGAIIGGAGLVPQGGVLVPAFNAVVVPGTLCPGDADGSGRVDLDDLTTVLANFGSAVAPYGPGDGDGSGRVDFDDLTTVLANFGIVCQ